LRKREGSKSLLGWEGGVERLLQENQSIGPNAAAGKEGLTALKNGFL